MSIWLQILNWSFKVSLIPYRGLNFTLIQMGCFLNLGCLEVALIWDTKSLSKAAVEQSLVR